MARKEPVTVAGCSSPEPVLYPNAHLQEVGVAQSKQDIAYCETLAAEYVKNPSKVKEAAARGAGGAAGGLDVEEQIVVHVTELHLGAQPADTVAAHGQLTR